MNPISSDTYKILEVVGYCRHAYWVSNATDHRLYLEILRVLFRNTLCNVTSYGCRYQESNFLVFGFFNYEIEQLKKRRISIAISQNLFGDCFQFFTILNFSNILS